MSVAPVVTTGELAERLEARLNGPSDLEIRAVNDLDGACAGEVSFIGDHAHARRWSTSAATAAVIGEGLEADAHDPERRALIHVANADLAMASLLEWFEPEPYRPPVGVHPTAWVDPAAVLGENVAIGPMTTVGADVRLGDGVTLHAGVHLYPAVTIGAGSELHAGVVIRAGTTIGARVIIHQNASIGADGFGYRPSADGTHIVKMPHLGTVRIEDDVEIGASACVDRGKFGATVIGRGTKIDNLVQIGHNCRIGQYCLVAGLAGLSGSVVLGDGVQIGGAAGILDHCTLGSGSKLGAYSATMHDIPPGEAWLGMPALRAKDALRQFASIRKLPGLMSGRSTSLPSE